MESQAFSKSLNRSFSHAILSFFYVCLLCFPHQIQRMSLLFIVPIYLPCWPVRLDFRYQSILLF